MSKGARFTLDQISRMAPAVQAQVAAALQQPSTATETASPGPVTLQPGVRLRQSSKPLLNKLETSFWDWMKIHDPEKTLRPQAKRYELGRGIWYKPDFTALHDGQEMAWEVKGPKAFRGGFENLKVAARVWPEVDWFLVWKADGTWKVQHVLA